MTKYKDDYVPNEEGAYPCRRCYQLKHKVVYPKIVVIEDLYYAQCTECRFFDIYEFLGISRKSAIKQWNETQLGNRTIAK